MNETSPVSIIVGALVTILAIGIAAGMVMNFGQQANQNTDTENFNGLVNSISDVCETAGPNSLGTIKPVRFRQHTLEIDENNQDFILKDVGNSNSGNEQASRDNICGDLDLKFTRGSSITSSDPIKLETGSYDFEITPKSTDKVEVKINAN
jgi:hypothetical protein